MRCIFETRLTYLYIVLNLHEKAYVLYVYDPCVCVCLKVGLSTYMHSNDKIISVLTWSYQ